MTRYQCDRCGQTITYPDSRYVVEVRIGDASGPGEPKPRERRDLCGKCMQGVSEAMRLPVERVIGTIVPVEMRVA